MKAILSSDPHPDTVIKIELSMTYHEAKDMYKACKQTDYYPIGFLQELFRDAIQIHLTEMEKIQEVKR